VRVAAAMTASLKWIPGVFYSLLRKQNVFPPQSGLPFPGALFPEGRNRRGEQAFAEGDDGVVIV
jgi:hypothetical protein